MPDEARLVKEQRSRLGMQTMLPRIPKEKELNLELLQPGAIRSRRALAGARAAAAAAPDAGGCVEQGIGQPVCDVEPTASCVPARRTAKTRWRLETPALLPHGAAGRR